jgi:PPOX class probable F420-dependent enzyme
LVTITFQEARYLNLATFRKSGRLVETPVWFADVEGTFYVFSAGNAGKIKRLKNSSRARIAPCDMRGNLLGPWRDAAAVIVHDPVDTERAHSALRKKYGWQMRLADMLSGLSGRRSRRAYIAITLDDVLQVDGRP